jgi:hypothetical protein
VDSVPAKVFDLTPNAPIIVAGVGTGGISHDLQTMLSEALTSTSRPDDLAVGEDHALRGRLTRG